MNPPEREFPFLTPLDDGLMVSVFVQPRASKNQICGVVGAELKIRLTSPPVDGAANKMCREFLAGIFRVSNSSVEIVSGETSRHKKVKVRCKNTEQLQSYIDALAVS